MTTATAYKFAAEIGPGGKLEFDVPFPTGTLVEVFVIAPAPEESAENGSVGLHEADLPPREQIGLSEADWPDSPETRAAILSKMEAVEPLEFSAADEAEIAAARKAVKDYTIAAVRKQMGLEP